MNPRGWANASRWERALGIGTGAMIVAILAILAWAVFTDAIPNRTVELQEQATATSDCRSAYAIADGVASANLDIRKAQVIDLFAQAVLLGDTEGLAAEFDVAQAALTAAIAERAQVALERDRSLEECRPDEHGDVHADPPEIEPITVGDP